MDEISLSVPEAIISSLPEDGDSAARDMQEAVAGWERRLNRLDENDELASAAVDVLERFESRWEQYDDFVAELRAWGQSPIYAMAWRDLHASLIQQLYDHEELSSHIDRERNARLVTDGIRPGR
ncbi:hypothetical protein ZOD2009_22112 [Haladaptatus paucihalophilus DX253]|uniref:Uncharacterized protein n=1 Tax=Haladaptatus paucihalophilus DX253 TaxID=797209 RepID=E7R028_HALPU|nr:MULTISPECIES: hypothetical protein [Haladaptatus]EFW89922.1 hypothetical protein ZOD2009_22112 [Haladaptatus paucihalophilus DX253]GKZ12937.1 hypothetical protein HAL_08180 [Haladaptatus sp. T7]SHK58279.1 hypothetical protein SAMN05444342_1751 [Haladaptatus paucihalophilus DX253]